MQQAKQLRLLIAAAATTAFALTSGQEDGAGLAFIKAGQDLALHPLNMAEVKKAEAALKGSALTETQPRTDDLAVRRLQMKTAEVVEKIWETLDNQQLFIRIQEKGVEREVLKMFRLIQSDVFAVDSQVSRSGIVSALKASARVSGSDSGRKWRESWELMQRLTGKIALFYSHFDRHMTSSANAGSSDVTRLAIEDFAKSIIQPGSTQDTAIVNSLSKLNKLVKPQPPQFDQNNNDDDDMNDRTNAALHKLYAVLQEKQGINLCNLGQSPHQLIYNLYNVIALTEIKGYAMVQFSYMMLRLYGKGNFTLESEMAKRNFQTQAAEKLLAVKSILPHMDQRYWKCDPPQANVGLTYQQLHLLQGHIENEVDMNDISTCRHSCSAYDVTEPRGCYKNLLCAKQPRCTGRLFDCQFYHADAWVCMSQNPQRRYDWIEYEDGRVLGNKGQCVNKIKVDSWWRWIFYHCSYCLCKCDAPGPDSDRFWSLKESVSNIGKNFVVTGVRLVKKGRVMHLEVEQAKALPEGSVAEASRVWKESRDIEIASNAVYNATTDSQGLHPDYMVMSYEQRSVDLDRLKAPPGHVVTGVKFRNLAGHLNLEIRVTPIKFREGKLMADQSVWISNDNTPASATKRTQVRILIPDVPTRFKGHSVIDSSTNQFVQFDTTSAEKDVMQTTIPFIDVQQVAPSTGTWLSGVGVYHKGALGYGGYLGMSVDTFNFANHLLPENGNGNGNSPPKTMRLMNGGGGQEDPFKYDFANENTNNDVI